MLLSLITLLGGIAIFIYGLLAISKNTEKLVNKKATKRINGVIQTPLKGLIVGTIFSSITQSSVAISVIAVSLVEAKALSFYLASAIIMGANIGTTVTAQLVSSSSWVGGVVGSISAIIGLLVGFSKKEGVKTVGEAVMGLGLLFAGLKIMSRSIITLSESRFFASIFLVKNPILLFLNGLTLTAITQSSSAVTGIMVILANSNIVTFKSSAILTLGSNVGSCFAVWLSSMGKSLEARRASIFNLVFNLIGSIMFFPIICLFGDKLSSLFLLGSKSNGRAVANFHTLFNLICSLIALPFLNSLTWLIKKIVREEKSR